LYTLPLQSKNLLCSPKGVTGVCTPNNKKFVFRMSSCGSVVVGERKISKETRNGRKAGVRCFEKRFFVWCAGRSPQRKKIEMSPLKKNKETTQETDSVLLRNASASLRCSVLFVSSLPNAC